QGPKEKTAPGSYASWDALRAELGRRIMAHPTARQNSSGKWDCQGTCHDGQGDTGLFYDPHTNQAHCNKKCDQTAILRAFGLPTAPAKNESEDGDEGVDDEPRMSKAAMAVELAAGAELFHNAEGRTFARVAVNGHLETWPLKSSSFKRWLGARFW